MANTAQIFNDAILAINNRDLKRAEELFRSVIKTDESHIGALNLLVVVLMSTERFAEAEPFIARAASLNQQSDVSFYNYGLISKRLHKPQQAFENFSKAIALNPDIAETWNNRGTVLNDLNKYDLAISDFDKAIAINSQYGEAYANKGKSLTLLKRNDEALAAYDKALSLKPDLAEAWLGRGNVFMDLERHDDAFAAYDKALSLKPSLEGAWLGRGDVLWNQKRYDDAFAAYDKALSLKPDLAEAWLGQGNALYRLRRLDEALAAYDKAIAQRPDLAEAWLGRANVFYQSKRHDEALAAYDKAIAQRPDLAEAWHKRGIIKVIRGNEQEGQKDCEQAVLLGASKEAVNFNLARYGVIKNVHIVPRKVIEEIFDDHARYFDSHLVNELEYFVPSKLFGLILQHVEKNTLVDALDLGCGTGLMGVQLRPIVKTLVGVDLSRQMLEKAKVRAIYNELACRDIIEFTKSDTRSYDLVTSTDVFIYVGDLSAVFDSVYHRLNVSGYFAFSVEATDEGNYILTESGRYRHTKEYLEQLGHDNGFEIHAIGDCILRKEDQRGIPGFLALMSRLR
jgi:predicted TPR repeat methyltransferase